MLTIVLTLSVLVFHSIIYSDIITKSYNEQKTEDTPSISEYENRGLYNITISTT